MHYSKGTPLKIAINILASSLITVYKPTQKNGWDPHFIISSRPKSPQKHSNIPSQPRPQPLVELPSNGVQELPAAQYLATWQPMGSLDQTDGFV